MNTAIYDKMFITSNVDDNYLEVEMSICKSLVNIFVLDCHIKKTF